MMSVEELLSFSVPAICRWCSTSHDMAVYKRCVACNFTDLVRVDFFCRHCGYLESLHAGTKCLFSPTDFRRDEEPSKVIQAYTHTDARERVF